MFDQTILLTTRLMLVQIVGGDPESVAQKKKSMLFSEIECLVFSYKSIAKIDSLKGLDSLTKLQLDNNFITHIRSIAHLVRQSSLIFCEPLSVLIGVCAMLSVTFVVRKNKVCLLKYFKHCLLKHFKQLFHTPSTLCQGLEGFTSGRNI